METSKVKIYIKPCRYCNANVESTSGKKLICAKCKPRSKEERRINNLREVKWLCKSCGILIKTTQGWGRKAKTERLELNCSDPICIEQRYDKRFPWMERNLTCIHCDKIMDTEQIRKSYQSKKAFSKHVCEECRIIGKKRVSDNMKKNNPMHREDVKTRVVNTMRQTRITNPEKFRDPVTGRGFGYKGKRILNADVRVLLYPIWTKPILTRDNFECTICQDTKNLQVHHIRPLREIIDEVLILYDMNEASTAITSATCPSIYHEIVQKCLDKHELQDGITYCKNCHIKNDSFYRVKGVKVDEN